MTKIDVIMPAWNSNCPYFPEVIRRVCNFVDLHRLIVIDRFSDDGTLEVLKRMIPKSKLLVIKSDCDLARARYLGIQQVKTSIFAFVDSDVLIPVNWQRCMEHWMQNEHVGAVSSPLCSENQQRTFKGPRIIKPCKNLNPKEIIKNGLFRTIRGYTFAAMIRTNLVTDWKPPANLSALEDLSLSQHVVSKGFLWVELPEPCCYHVKELKHGSGVSRYLKQGLWEGANARIIGVKARYFLLETCSRTIGGTLNALVHQDPQSLLNNIFLRAGYLIGFLLPQKFRVWHRL
jgi:glycosyltransferase involved in cell wall biosynthesis